MFQKKYVEICINMKKFNKIVQFKQDIYENWYQNQTSKIQ